MKRLAALLLSVFMIFSLFNFNVSAETEVVNEEKKVLVLPEGDQNSPSYQALLEQLGEKYLDSLSDEDWNKKQSFIIELNDETSERQSSSRSRYSYDALQLMNERKASQQIFKEEVNRTFGNVTHARVKRSLDNNRFVERSFSYLLNGMTMNLTLKEAFLLTTNPKVKAIYLDSKINRPENNEITPLMYNTTKMVKSGVANTRGYNGEGRVVAIVDSGADHTHPDLRLSDVSKAKYPTQASMQAMIEKNALKGQWYSDKIPYGYNYFDHDFNIKDTNQDTGMHGMHIAGTIAANQEKAGENGLLMRGVVPEAQLLVMRVFGERIATTNTSAYIEAIDDAVLLGADSINMSLGSTGGLENNLPLTTLEVIKRARAKGVMVVIAAGNDSNSLWGLKGDDAPSEQQKPKLDNPSYGVVGSPAIADESFAVASFNNSEVFYENKISYVDETSLNVNEPVYAANQSPNQKKDNFELNTQYKVVEVGLGKEDDYKDKDVNGKIALVMRGEISFAEKVKRAGDKGAVAVLVANHGNEGEDYLIFMQMGGEEGLVPSYSMSKRQYDRLKRALDANPDFTLAIGGASLLESPNSGKMSDFTSWGPTPALKIKPEISAPGGNIYSTFNVDNGKYGEMSGTSMATPHVTAGVSAINSFLEKNDIFEDDRYQLAKNILMVTADPIKYPDSENYYSVRIQGAGLMNLDKATNPNFVSITDENNSSSKGKSKIELGSIKDGKFSINVKLNNHSKTDVTYNVKAYVATDGIKDDRFTMSPELLKNVDLGTVTVGKNSEVTFTKEIDVANELQPYLAKATLGVYVEGFIFFEPVNAVSAEGVKLFENLSIPFLGFNGDWDNLPVMEKFIDEYKDGETALFNKFATKENAGSIPWLNRHFTHFVTETKGGNQAIEKSILGAANVKVNNVNIYTATDNFAISPNNDKNQDYLALRAVFQRAWQDFRITITKKDSTEPIYEINPAFLKTGDKNFYLNERKQNASTYNELWSWSGQDKDGNTVEDGEYYFNIEVRPGDINNAQKQIISKKVYVDTVAPNVEVLEYKVEDGKLKLKINATDETSGLKVLSITYIGGESIKPVVLYGDQLVNGENNIEMDVPANFDVNKRTSAFLIKTIDWAGNVTDRRLKNQPGKITINKVMDGEGTVIAEDPIVIYGDTDRTFSDLNNLPLGKYTPIYKADYPGYEITFDPEEVELTAEEPTKEITVTYKKLDTNDFSQLIVNFMNLDSYPSSGRVEIKAAKVKVEDGDIVFDKDGAPVLERVYDVPRYRYYQNNIFKTKLPEGVYIIYPIDNGTNRQITDVIQDRPFVILGKQTDTEVTIKYAPESLASVYITIASKDVELTDYIAPNDITERGEGISRKKFLNNENSRYFDIYEMDTELRLTPQEAEIVREGTLPNGVKYISLKVDVPNGNYYVNFNNHDTTRYMTLVYNSPTATILPDAFRPLSTEAIVEILPKSDVRGSLTIKHEFLKQEYRDNPPHLEYDVYNEAFEPVTNLQQLPVGTYTIVPKTTNGFRPERTRYQVNITEDNLNPEVEIRWFNIEDETKHPAELEVGITGEPSYSYKDKIVVTLTNKTTKEKFVAEFNMPENNITRISVNRGRYEVTTNLPENYDYKIYSSRGNKGDKTQEQPDNLMIQEAYEYLEIELIKRTPAIEKTDTALEINENVKDLGATYILEEVDEQGRVINRYNSSRPKFINLNAGKYVLTVDEVPNGYIAVPRSKNVEIKEGTNSVDVNFYKKARYNIVNMVNGKDAAKEKDDTLPYFGVTYEAKANVNGETITFKEGEFPEGIELTIYPKNVTKGYRVVTEEKQVTLPTDDIVFEYVTEDNALEELVKIAEEVLKDEDLTSEYKALLEKVVNADKEYLAGDNQTPEETEKKIKELIELLNNKEYIIRPYWPEDTIEDRPIEWENDQVVVKPQEPKENKEEKEEPKQEDKKDYGILVPERNINITFKDVENVSNKEEILDLAQRGILKGDDLGNFNPDDKVTRAMLVETLYRISKDRTKDFNKNYVDLKTSDWYYESIMWASAKNIIQGNDNNEAMPNKELTREELAVIMARYLKEIPFEIKKAFTYPDENQISDWAKAAIKEMDEKGIVTGRDVNNYSPKEGVTRKELAHTLYVITQRVLELSK